MNSHNELSQEEYYQLFHRSCFPHGNDWRLDLEPRWLSQLSGEYRKRAIEEVTHALEEFDFGFRGRIVTSARCLLQREAVPLLEKGWRHVMDKIKRGDSQSRDYYGILGHLGAALYDLTQDEQYITDIVESVREDPCSAFDNVMRLFRVPTSIATIDSAWRRLGREGDQSTRDLCLEYLDRRLDDPMMKEYIQTLPVNEGRDMMRAVAEYRAQIRERMARQQDLDMLVHSYVESGMSIQQALDLIRKSRR